MISRRTTLKGLAAGALAAAAGPSRAQTPAPDDRSTMQVFVGAASSMDFTARAIAEQLRESTGRTAIAVARLGAGQRLALGEVRRAPPDGRNIVFATSGPFAIYPHIYTKLEYDPEADFTPIMGISKFDVAIATGPMTGATDLRELIAWTRRNPNGALYGSAPGNGSFSHFVGIATSSATGTKLEHVPYKDSAVGIVDLAGGRIPILITGMSALVASHQTGKVRVLAVSGPTRSPLLPDVPTLRESGINVSSSTTTGVFGPAKLPADVVERLATAIRPLFNNRGVVSKLEQQGVVMAPASGAELAATIREERAYFGRLAKESGYVPEQA